MKQVYISQGLESSNLGYLSKFGCIYQDSFGSLMPGREYTAQSVAGYRFGFNTQEKDDEIYGKGNASSAQFWEYHTRLGRRWNVDPKPTIGISEYVCFENNPIYLTDFFGDVVDPKRTKGMNFFICPDKKLREQDRKDHGGGIKGFFTSAYTWDYLKAKTMQVFSRGTLAVIEARNCKDAARKIIQKCGETGYIKNLTVDFHAGRFGGVRSGLETDDSKMGYTVLAERGLAGEQTTVFLANCWAGGNAELEQHFPRSSWKYKNYTQITSFWLDGATVVGYQSTNSSISFLFGRNFMGPIYEEYAKTEENKNAVGKVSVSNKYGNSTQIVSALKLSISGELLLRNEFYYRNIQKPKEFKMPFKSIITSPEY